MASWTQGGASATESMAQSGGWRCELCEAWNAPQAVHCCECMMANSGATAAAAPPPAAEPCEALGVQASSSDETRANTVETLRAELAEARLQRAEAERQRAEAERQRAEAERQRAEGERQRAEAERQIAALQVAAQQAAAEQDQRAVCIVCQDRPTCMFFLPCRHVCLCEVCSRLPELRLCPLYREAIDGSLHVYL